jgi:hypothetical protein
MFHGEAAARRELPLQVLNHHRYHHQRRLADASCAVQALVSERLRAGVSLSQCQSVTLKRRQANTGHHQ